MSKRNYNFIFTVLLLVYSNLIHASTQPTFSIIPTTPTTIQVASGGLARVSYLVTNSTKITRTLTLIPELAIRQISNNSSSCASPFTLLPGQSCLLTLEINGSQVPQQGIHTGPVICKTQGSGSNLPDLFLCSRPSVINLLNVSRINALSISINPSFLVLYANSGVQGIITVTNNSTTSSALNIRATLPASWTDVIQDATDCAIVAPGASCRLIFTPGSTVHPQALIPIMGTNTNQVFARISVALSPFAYISNALGYVQLCRVNVATGLLSSCIDSGAGVTFFAPDGMAINSTGTLMYVVNNTNSNVSLCNRDPITGFLSGCINSGATALTFPRDITLIGNFAYVTDNPNNIRVYSINPTNGLLSLSSSATVVDPAYLVFNSAGSVVYITQTSANSVLRCNVDATSGALTGCIDSGVGSIFQGPTGIAINNTDTIAYVANNTTGRVSICTINPTTQQFSSCAVSPIPTLSDPNGMFLNANNTEAYFTNVLTNSVTRCVIDSTGNFSSCGNSGATGLTAPLDIILSS